MAIKTPEIDFREDFGTNYIINGNLDFWQRVSGATTTINTAASVSALAADRFFYTSGGGTNVKNYSIVRSTDVPTEVQSGFKSSFSYSFSAVSQQLTWAAGDYLEPFLTSIEGYNFSALMGKTFTLSFWFKATHTGNYSVSFRNSSIDRSYVTTFAVNAANTWEFKEITVSHNTAGVWDITNGAGLRIAIAEYGGSNFTTSSTDQWISGNFINVSGSVNPLQSGFNMKISQVSLQEGRPMETKVFRRAGKDVANELMLCQRYFERWNVGLGVGILYGQGFTTTTGEFPLRYLVKKRATPTLTQTGTWNVWFGGGGTAVSSFVFQEINDEQATISLVYGAGLGAGASIQLFPNGTPGVISIDAEI